MKQKNFLKIAICLFLISNIAYAQRTPSAGTAAVFESNGTGNLRILPIEDTFVLAVYKREPAYGSGVSSTDDLYAIIGEVDATNKTISWVQPN